MYVAVVTYKERVHLQWQKVNQGIPQWQKVKCWYPIRVMLKGRWDIGWFENPQRVVPLPNQPNLFLILRVIYVCHTKVRPFTFIYTSLFLLMT